MINICGQYIKLFQPEGLRLLLHLQDVTTVFGAEYADYMAWVIAEPLSGFPYSLHREVGVPTSEGG